MQLCFHLSIRAFSSLFSIVFKPRIILKTSEEMYVFRRHEYLVSWVYGCNAIDPYSTQQVVWIGWAVQGGES